MLVVVTSIPHHTQHTLTSIYSVHTTNYTIYNRHTDSDTSTPYYTHTHTHTHINMHRVKLTTHLHTLWLLVEHNARFASIWPFSIRQHRLEHIAAHAQNQPVSVKEMNSDLQLDIAEVSLSVQLEELLESCPRVVHLLSTGCHLHRRLTSPLGSIVLRPSHGAGVSFI